MIALSIVDSAVLEVNEVENLEDRLGIFEEMLPVLSGERIQRGRQILQRLFEGILKARDSAKQDVAVASGAKPVSYWNALLQRTIEVATRFSPELATEFLERSGWNSDQPASSGRPDLSANLYLATALSLLNEDQQRAVAYAERSLSGGIQPTTMNFLGKLSELDRSLADRFFRVALSNVVSQQGFNVNELLLLSSYVLTPGRAVVLSPFGPRAIQIPGYPPDHVVDPLLAREFLQTVTPLLLNEARYTLNGTSPLKVRPAGDFFFLKYLEPYVREYEPSLASVFAERTALAATFVSSDLQPRLESGAGPSAVAGPSIDQRLEQAARAPTAIQRDHRYFLAAVAMAGEGKEESDQRALSTIEKMSSRFRDTARDYIRYLVAKRLVTQRQLGAAEEWARRDSDPGRRASVFISIAGSLQSGRGDLAKARSLLDEAERLTSKLDASDERVSLLLAAVSVRSRFDSVSALQTLSDAFTAANKVTTFTGLKDANRTLMIGPFEFVYSLGIGGASVNESLRRLATSDFIWAQSISDGLKNRVFRIKSLMAVCNGILVKGSTKSDRSLPDTSVSTPDRKVDN